MCLSNRNTDIKLQRIEDVCNMHTMCRAHPTECFLKNIGS